MMELKSVKKRAQNILQKGFAIPKVSVLVITLTILLVIAVRLYHPSFSPAAASSSSSSAAAVHSHAAADLKKCDIFTGEWVPNPDAPYYTNDTCFEIQHHQNCLKHGRPDTGYLKWRWQPDQCDLPIFDPNEFLELVKGKSLAFVGDSVARNQMQSLICLLSRAEFPVDVSEVKGSPFKRWSYVNHNFTLAIYWSPFLVKTTDSEGPTKPEPFNLYLDEFDEKWTVEVEEFDYLIISAGHWFFRPTMYYEKGHLVGCLYCSDPNVTHLEPTYAYQRAFRTAFRAVNSLENYKGLTFLRTFTPSHFEGGSWDKGGNCMRTRPFRSNQTKLEGLHLDMYLKQVQEYESAGKEGLKKGLEYRLLDTTRAMQSRPDGHPSKYGHEPNEKVVLFNDCVHWCLPGPIDTWNDFLLHMLKMEARGHPVKNGLFLEASK